MPALPLLGRRLHHEVIEPSPTDLRPDGARPPLTTRRLQLSQPQPVPLTLTGPPLQDLAIRSSMFAAPITTQYAPAAARPTAIALRVVVLSNAIRLLATIGWAVHSRAALPQAIGAWAGAGVLLVA